VLDFFDAARLSCQGCAVVVEISENLVKDPIPVGLQPLAPSSTSSLMYILKKSLFRWLLLRLSGVIGTAASLEHAPD
jgi:hypothetical protein